MWNYEVDKEIFNAKANTMEALEGDDGTKTSAIISGILASKKQVSTPKKYKKQLELTEKFEAMSSEERQVYLDALEKEIRCCAKNVDFFEKSSKEDTSEYTKVITGALKTGANIGVCGAILGMSAVAPNEEVFGAVIGGASATMLGIHAHLVEHSIKDFLYHKKLNRLTDEWVACSMAENLSEKEM